jgi:tetratricopeptide (TPR) repeat protein
LDWQGFWDPSPTVADEDAFDERMRTDVRPEKLEPQTAYERQELGDALCNEGRVREAMEQYRKAVEMERENPSYHIRLGDAFAYSEMSVKAVAEYKKALKISPRRAEPHFSLAEIYRRYGKWMAAVAEYRKATQFNAMNPFYRYKLSQALWHTGMRDEALLHL